MTRTKIDPRADGSVPSAAFFASNSIITLDLSVVPWYTIGDRKGPSGARKKEPYMAYQVGEIRRIYGTIAKLFYRGENNWISARFEPGPGQYKGDGLTGNADPSCREGTSVVMDAEYVDAGKYGKQWKALSGTVIYPAGMSEFDLAAFCGKDKRLRAVSKAGIHGLWQAAGRDALMRAITAPDELLKAAGLSVGDASAVQAFAASRGPAPLIKAALPHMPKYHVERIAAAQLTREGTPMAARDRVEQQLEILRSWNSVAGRRGDPFGTLCGEWRCPLKVADEVFLEDLGGSDFDGHRIRRVMWTAIEQELKQISGANYVPVDEEAGYWRWFRRYFENVEMYRPVPRMSPDGCDLSTDDGFMAFVARCASDGEFGIELDRMMYGPLAVRRLYSDRMLFAERVCALVVADAAAQPDRFAPPRGMASWSGLDDGQKAAVRTVLKKRLSFVAGGPGSGKTRTLGAIAEAWKVLFPEGQGVEIMVLAPTGKAANRAKGSTGCPCCGTIDRLFAKNHELLEQFGSSAEAAALSQAPDDRYIEAVSTGSFKVCRDSLVIVDESSMIDVEKAGKLLWLLRGCTIVFAGDADQLPPIERGAFFRECLDSNRAAVARLSENHRSASNWALPAAAAKVRDGVALDKSDFSNFNPLIAKRLDQMDLALMVADDHGGAPGVLTPAEKVVVEEYRRLLRSGADPRDIMVLAPFRGSAPTDKKRPYRLSVYCLNGLLQDVVNPVQPGGVRSRGKDDEGSYVCGKGAPTGVFDAQGREIRIGDRLLNLSNLPGRKWEQYEGYDFLAGDRVPQPGGENVGVFNGEGGIVRRAYAESAGNGDDGPKPCRLLLEMDDPRSREERDAYPDKPKWFIMEAEAVCVSKQRQEYHLKGWCLGYAMTIHKSQGCEAPHVILALSSEGFRYSSRLQGFLSRNLLYTGLTRSSGSCLVVGTLEFINFCVMTSCACRFIALKDRVRREVAAMAENGKE